MGTRPVKRFIAGAVCPSCAEMDKIVMYQDDEGTWRECVRCGYRNKMSAQEVTELPTRVSAKKAGAKPQTQAIKFYPSPKKD